MFCCGPLEGEANLLVNLWGLLDFVPDQESFRFYVVILNNYNF
jgi:hypothetical protein